MGWRRMCSRVLVYPKSKLGYIQSLGFGFAVFPFLLLFFFISRQAFSNFILLFCCNVLHSDIFLHGCMFLQNSPSNLPFLPSSLSCPPVSFIPNIVPLPLSCPLYTYDLRYLLKSEETRLSFWDWLHYHRKTFYELLTMELMNTKWASRSIPRSNIRYWKENSTNHMNTNHALSHTLWIFLILSFTENMFILSFLVCRGVYELVCLQVCVPCAYPQVRGRHWVSCNCHTHPQFISSTS